jgi:acetate---CoA ligase (ADP-forming) subunit beta
MQVTADEEWILEARQEIAQARAAGQPALDEPRAKRLLQRFGLTVPRGGVADDLERASKVAADLTAPLAAKLVSPDGIHKSDIGGVRLGLMTAADVTAAVSALAEAATRHGARVTGYLIEEMAPAGTEIVIGGMTDARFGPVVMLGLGGVFVEIFADTAFRVCPIDAVDARDMIDELKAAPLLRGARGRRPASEEAIVQALLAVGGESGLLMSLSDEIEELDINPLIVSEQGAVACDARVILRRPEEGRQ